MSDSNGIDYSSPFRVRIIEDCRRDVREKLDGSYGTCLGSYDYPDISSKSDDGSPLIRADNGQYLWGCECWWAQEKIAKDVPLARLRDAVEVTKERVGLLYHNDN